MQQDRTAILIHTSEIKLHRQKAKKKSMSNTYKIQTLQQRKYEDIFVSLIVRKVINFDFQPVSITNCIKYLAMGMGNEVAFPPPLWLPPLHSLPTYFPFPHIPKLLQKKEKKGAN